MGRFPVQPTLYNIQQPSHLIRWGYAKPIESKEGVHYSCALNDWMLRRNMSLALTSRLDATL